MQQLFVEMYNDKKEWIHLSGLERGAFVETVTSALARLQGAGVEVMGSAINSLTTDHRAPYDFFCVYRVPDVALQRTFEAGIAACG